MKKTALEEAVLFLLKQVYFASDGRDSSEAMAHMGEVEHEIQVTGLRCSCGKRSTKSATISRGMNWGRNPGMIRRWIWCRRFWILSVSSGSDTLALHFRKCYSCGGGSWHERTGGTDRG